MGIITRNLDDQITITYDQNEIDAEVDLIFLKHSLKVFSFLVKRSEKITFQELIIRIKDSYFLSKKVRDSISIIEKASIKYKFSCKYDLDGVGTDLVISVKSGDWSNVSSILNEGFGEKIKRLTLIGMSCSYKKGCISFL